VSDNVSQAPQLPKTLCGNEGVLECSGLTELGMGIERADVENPKRCQATAVQETRIRSEFLENDHLRGLAWDCGSFERERGSRGSSVERLLCWHNLISPHRGLADLSP
jgi:hypothetical protein